MSNKYPVLSSVLCHQCRGFFRERLGKDTTCSLRVLNFKTESKFLKHMIMIHTIDVNVKIIVQPHDLMSSKSLVTIHFMLKDNAQALQDNDYPVAINTISFS